MRSVANSDIRQAIRALSASPWFTAVAILSLAIAVCVASGIVAVLDASKGRSSPFRNVRRAVALYRPDAELEQGRFASLSRAALERISRESRTVTSLAAFSQDQVTVRTDDEAGIVRIANASAMLPTVIGVRAAVGRVFVGADDLPGAPPSVVLGYSLWRGRFGADSGIVGRSVDLDGRAHLVIGVLEPRAEFPNHVDLWRLRPLREMIADTASYPGAVALLAPGATAQEASAELSALGAMPASGPNRRRVRTLAAAPLSEYLSGQSKGALLFLSMIGIVVGLIAATNFAALVLARGMSRRADLAIRAALGASTGRLVAFMLAECLLVAVAGGALGGALAPLAVQGMGAYVAFMLPGWMQLSFSLPVVLSAIALAVIIAVVFGMAPAMELARPAALGAPRGDFSATRRLRSGRRLLVGGQVALATGPLVFATVLFGGLFHFGSPSLGFDQRNLYQGTVRGSARDASWRAAAARSALLDEVRAVPGVSSAAISHVRILLPDDVRATGASGPAMLSGRFAELHEVTPDFFTTYAPEVVAGRLPTSEELQRGDPVAVVNTSTLRALSFNTVVGWRLQLHRDVEVTVVGIVADVRQTGFERNPVVRVYAPMSPTANASGWSETLWVRAMPGAARLAASIYAAVPYDAGMAPLADLKPSVDVTTAAARELRSFVGITLAMFVVALVLAAIGLYGTITYAAVMRRKELAVRLALGARRTHLAGVVMREAAQQALVGLTFGIAGGHVAALSIPNAASSISFPPPDVVLTAVVAFATMLAIAALGPVRRVWATDCAVTLREDG